MYQQICEKSIKICPKCVQKDDRNNFHIFSVFFKENTSQKGPSECPWTALGRLVASIGRLLGSSWRLLGASWTLLGLQSLPKCSRKPPKGLPKASKRPPRASPKAPKGSPKRPETSPKVAEGLNLLLATLLPPSCDFSVLQAQS